MGCIGTGLQRIDQRRAWQWRYKYRYLVRKKEGLLGKEREGSKKEGTERGVCVESEGVSIASTAPASLKVPPVLPGHASTALEGAVPLHNVPLAPSFISSVWVGMDGCHSPSTASPTAHSCLYPLSNASTTHQTTPANEYFN